MFPNDDEITVGKVRCIQKMRFNPDTAEGRCELSSNERHLSDTAGINAASFIC